MNQTLFFRLLNLPLFLGLGLSATTILMHPAASRARPVDSQVSAEIESETAPLAEKATEESRPKTQQPASPEDESANDRETQLTETETETENVQSERSVDAAQPRVTITTAPRIVVRPHQPSTTNRSVTKSKPEKIVVVNTSDTYPVAFLLDDEVRKLEPKESMELEDTAELHFDRGGNFGTSSRELTVGRYEFELTPGGWALFGLDE